MFIVPITQMMAISPLEKGTTAGGEQAIHGNPFADIYKRALQDLEETQAASNADAYRLAMGQADDLHNITINSEKAATALELTVQLTTRAVGAYNEIMRMQV